MTPLGVRALSRNAGRRAGAIYLLYFVLAFGGGALARGLLAPRDPAAVLANVAEHADSYRLAASVNLLSMVAYLALIVALYELFAGEHRATSRFAAAVGVCGCALQGGASMLQLAPLLVLPGTALFSTLGAATSQLFAIGALALYSQSYAVSLVLFAFYDLAIGALIVRTSMVPRTLGMLLMLAGAGWLVFLWPPLARLAAGIVLPLGAIAELVLMLWLLARGVRDPQGGVVGAP